MQHKSLSSPFKLPNATRRLLLGETVTTQYDLYELSYKMLYHFLFGMLYNLTFLKHKLFDKQHVFFQNITLDVPLVITMNFYTNPKW